MPNRHDASAALHAQIETLLAAREGHFALESGHHGNRWLDLERLFLHPERVQPIATALADRLAPHGVETVCSPLVEGAFVGLFVASALRIPFTYTERAPQPERASLFPWRYVVPKSLQPELRGRRIAVVNDVINAGSAVRATLDALATLDARPVVIATLAVLGEPAQRLATERAVALETLASLPNDIWAPEVCPLCGRGVPLTD